MEGVRLLRKESAAEPRAYCEDPGFSLLPRPGGQRRNRAAKVCAEQIAARPRCQDQRGHPGIPSPSPRLCRAVREACASAPPCAQLPARLLPVAQQRRCEMLAAKHTRSAPALLGAGPQRQMGCGLHLAPSFILHRVLMPPGTPYATKRRDF